jgi:hypothetical protein
MASLEQARREVDRCVRELGGFAEGSGSAGEVEAQVWVGVLAVGRAVMTLFFAHRTRQRSAGRYVLGARSTPWWGGRRRSWVIDRRHRGARRARSCLAAWAVQGDRRALSLRRSSS